MSVPLFMVITKNESRFFPMAFRSRKRTSKGGSGISLIVALAESPIRTSVCIDDPLLLSLLLKGFVYLEENKLGIRFKRCFS